ncbi:hypothetical protein B0H17DRAFT_1196593 [Mycena rosella]|uniref:F-box domain-containing protein n=1 Tax=Mycena rosella TaxID=1033263 RepID=A0AAD7GKI6_MYCRO|nr:hypothetical protein B0H17DRAFT_1196593 [Mycena rosella]
MSVAQSLPTEIVEQIIGQLQPDDKGKTTHDVGACGLVCRGWLPSSRYQIFARLYLTIANIDSFLGIVQTSPFPIASFVRYLGLEFDGSDPLVVQRLDGLGPFPQVTRLRIYGLTHPPNLALLARLGRRSFGNVTTLDFFMCMFPFNSVLAALSSFPSLERLGLRSSFFRRGSGTRESSICQLPTQLHALHINVQNPTGEDFFENILSLDPIPVLSSLSLHGTWPAEDSFMKKYLSHLGSRLQYLRLDTVFLGDPVSLHYSTNLRRLDLRIHHPEQLTRSTLPILRSLCSQNLTAIALNITSGTLGHDTEFLPLWRELDEVLTTEWFSNLRSFTIMVDSESSRVDASDFEEYMPISSVRGIFRIVWRSPVVERDILDFQMECEN